MNQNLHIFDRNLYGKRRQRLQSKSEAFSKLTSEIANRLVERLRVFKKDFKTCWQIGFDNGAVFNLATNISLPCMQKCEIFVTSDHTYTYNTPSIHPNNTYTYNVCCDEEALPIDVDALDMIISPLGFQWVNDIKGTLLQCLYGLKPDGLTIAALIGEDSLWELQSVFRQIESRLYGGVSNRFAPLISSQSASSLLQSSGFALPVVDRDRIILSYPDVMTLLKDIKDSGHANMLLDRQSPPLTKRFLMSADDLYKEEFPLPGGRIQVTLDIVFMSGWSPSSKQQKPLKPGSAKYSLTNVLS
jgi:NADH dehydrogenase [ubiquinone] 1 alpha subcomplex assembly factor 5